MTPADPRVSVIIRTRDEEHGIGRVLAGLASQNLAERTEVIVVDSGSSDRTVEIAEEAGARVVRIPAESFTFGWALNVGCAEARGEIGLALSGHAFPTDDGWLERMVRAFDDPRVACASGNNYGPHDEVMSERVTQDAAMAVGNPLWGYSNAHGAFRLDLWRAHPFRPEMPGTEDKEWAWWWLNRGFVYVSEPAFMTDHDHSKDPVFSQYERARREWVGFAMYLDLEPMPPGELVRRWWYERDTYRSALRARLSHRRASRLLGQYAGRRPARRRSEERRAENLLDRLRPEAEALGFSHAPRPLRLAVLTDVYPRLSETFVVAEVEELARQGHVTRVWATERGAQEPRRPLPRRRAGEPPPVKRQYVIDEGRPAKLEALLWALTRHPVACLRDLVERRRWSREEEVAGLRAIAVRARGARRLGAQHLHAHFAHRSALEAMRISRLLGLSYSVTAHAWDIYLAPRNLEEKLVRSAFSTSGCDYTVDHLRSLVGPGAGARITKIVMGVDPERFRRETPLPGGRHVLAIGRLVEKKGFVDLVDASAQLRARNQADRVTILGDGPLRSELTARISSLGLDGFVHLRGSADPLEVRDALERADILVMPCVVAHDGDRDSMPVVVKEAMAMEVMVVGTRVAGLPEMIGDDRGRLVDPGDPPALADAIAGLLGQTLDQRQRMGAAGRAWVCEHANLESETERLVGLIRAAVAHTAISAR